MNIREEDTGNDAAAPDANQSAHLAVSERDSITNNDEDDILKAAFSVTGGTLDHRSPADRFLEAALRYMRLGCSVIPADGKTPLVNWTEFQQRRADETEIRGWWEAWPEANVGIVTGEISGIVVLDVDGQPGVDTLRDRGWSTGETAIASTGKGWHHFYRHPGFEVRNFARTIGSETLDGIDFRGDGGFVVVAPSIHANGNEYAWIVGLDDCPPARMPDWLLTLVSNRQKSSVHAATGPTGIVVEGMRNVRLASLAGTLRRQGLDESGIAAALLSYNKEHCTPPLNDAEVRKIAVSIARYDPGTAPFRLTDAGNAERFASQHGEDFRYVHARKSWFVFDGSRWARDATEEASRRMLDTVRRIAIEAQALVHTNRDLADDLYKHAKVSERRERLNAGLGVAQSLLPLKQARLDADPWVLNLRNGTLDLKTGELHDHRRDDWLSKRASVAYDPDATCPRWMQFLDEVLDPELAVFIRRVVGYALTGITSEHCFFLLHGSGRNGKSTFLNVLSHMLDDYAGNTPPDTFLSASNTSKSTNDLAALAGTRFVTTFEPSEGARLADSLVKQITGGDPLTVRFLYQEFFTYTPQMKVFMSANHRPRIDYRDDAMWERVRLINFGRTIPRDKRDRRLTERLIAEAPGILNWALEGLAEWRQEGLGHTPIIDLAVEAYREASDPFARFLAECCRFEDEARAPKPELRAVYERWAADNSVEPLGPKRMREALLQTGIDEGNSTSAGGRYWDGLRLED